jgi:hypothetical protein
VNEEHARAFDGVRIELSLASFDSEEAVQLGLPLSEEGLGDDQEHTSYALSEELGDDDTCFDGLAQTDFVGQDAASFRNAAEREDYGVYLVRVWVDSTAPLSGGIASVLIGASQACKVFGEQPTMDGMGAVHVSFAKRTSSWRRSNIF